MHSSPGDGGFTGHNATDDYVHAATYMSSGHVAEWIGKAITVTRRMALGSYGNFARRGAVRVAAQNIAAQPAYAPGEHLWGSNGRAGIGSTRARRRGSDDILGNGPMGSAQTGRRIA
jgi:hypothetical protein